MSKFTQCFSHIWLPLSIGLAVLGVLLLAAQPTITASTTQADATNVFILWLAPPKTPTASRPWAISAENHADGWRSQAETVAQRLSTLKQQESIADFETLPGSVGFQITAIDKLPQEVHTWPEVAQLTSDDEVTPEALAAWWQQGFDLAGVMEAERARAQAAASLTLNLGVSSHMVSGATPSPDTITFELRRDGNFIAQTSTTPFPDGRGGYVYVATLYGYARSGGGDSGYYCDMIIAPGDVLQAIQAGQTVTLTVPLLTAWAEQSTNKVYGQAAPSTTLELYHYRYDDPTTTYRQTITATASSVYEAVFDGMTEIKARDYGYVYSFNETGNHVYARYNAPYLLAMIDDDYAEGIAAPCAPITISTHLPDGKTIQQNHTTANTAGEFDMYLYNAPRPLQIGDTLIVTAAHQVMNMTLLPITAYAAPENNTISGATLPGAEVLVELYTGNLLEYEPGTRYTRATTAALTGTLASMYSVDFSDLVDITAGNYGYVYVSNASGHQTYRPFVVPFLKASLKEYGLSGQVNASGQATVTVWGRSGIPRDTHYVQIHNDGTFYDPAWESQLNLLAGDHITVTSPDGAETGMAIPHLTASFDPEHTLVYGEAPPSSTLRVEFSQYTRWITCTASGVYTADFGSLSTLIGPYDYGRVTHINRDGYEAYVNFRVPPLTKIRVQSGNNLVYGTLPVDEWEEILITVRSISGTAKVAETVHVYYEGEFHINLYHNGKPVIIQAGDTVEIAAKTLASEPEAYPSSVPTVTPSPHLTQKAYSSDDILISVTVPTLTLQADQDADTLSGQAPANAPLGIVWTGSDPWDTPSNQSWAITTTHTGSYILDLSDDVDLERGDRIDVTWTDEAGNEVWISHIIPRLWVDLRQRYIHVNGPAYTPMALTLSDANGTPIYTATATFDENDTHYFFSTSEFATGQTLTANLVSEVMTLTLPRLSAQANPEADTVSGQAPPGARLIIQTRNWDYYYSCWAVTATITGTFSTNFEGKIDIGHKDTGRLIYLSPQGHRIELWYTTPRTEVMLDFPDIRGMAPEQGRVTAILLDKNKSIKGSGYDFNWEWYFLNYSIYITNAQQEPVPVVSGDTLIITTTNTIVTRTIPLLTGDIDSHYGILNGVAPSQAWLSVDFRNASRRVQVAPEGTYAIDLGDLSPNLREEGYVIYTDGEGNLTQLRFTVTFPYALYLPLTFKNL